ncbi:Helicase domino [Wickerhamomyces ciferrii]|uniref:Helicase domino n=1 Tax=Wickerhamomyces ciferrii (strain ATCC 14091 / BCRC 22168 / CBS 111 / JCM 3599 / NBRC 0793 / NRRL Y-1031 F-60-10) TaxID=1206466 RepID=K0KSX5_WICCF|nr:Helicase domino [Wickerhamomyces ciferrii]CCH45152.1 Helicase domino [Wickerhamomyces ciferrii]
MSVKSLKIIKSLDKLPSYFKQANASFLRFKEYHSKDPLISYFVTDLLDCAVIYEIVRGLFPFEEIIGSNISIKSQPEEEEEVELNLPKVPKNDDIKDIDETKELNLLNVPTDFKKNVSETDKTDEIKEDQSNESQVERVESNESESQKEETKEDKSSEDKPAENSNESSQLDEKQKPDEQDDDLTGSLAKLVQSVTDDTNIEDHISQSIKHLSPIDYQDQVSKEDEIINKIINTDLNRITDDEINERIQYCKKNSKRIITSIKKGENPQINPFHGDNIDNKPISNEDIEKVLKFALNEPDEDDEKEIKFPELPTSIPNDQIENEDEKEEEEEELEKREEDIEDEEQSLSDSKPIHKQLEKEDIEQFLQDGELLNNASKNAKFAISAINYEDVDTAIGQLNKSLHLLQQYKDRN